MTLRRVPLMVPEDFSAFGVSYAQASFNDDIRAAPRDVPLVDSWSDENLIMVGELVGAFAYNDAHDAVEVLRSGLYVVHAYFGFDSLDQAAPSGPRPGYTSAYGGFYNNGSGLLNIQASGGGAGTASVDSAFPAPFQPQQTDVVWMSAGDSIAGYMGGDIKVAGYTTPRMNLSGGLYITALALA